MSSSAILENSKPRLMLFWFWLSRRFGMLAAIQNDGFYLGQGRQNHGLALSRGQLGLGLVAKQSRGCFGSLRRGWRTCQIVLGLVPILRGAEEVLKS